MSTTLTLLKVSEQKALKMAAKLARTQKDWDFLGPGVLKQVEAEVTPPGYENVVSSLKRKGDIDNPWAVTWAMYGHGVRPGKATEAGVSYSGGSQLLRAPKSGRSRFVPFANDIKDNASAKHQQQHEILRKERAANRMQGKDTEKNCTSESARPESVRYGVVMREASAKDGYDRIETVIMTEGMGNKKDRHFYPASTIQRDYKKFEGKASFVNHQDEEEAQIRPERDLRDQIGWWENVKVSEDGREMTAALVFEKTTVGQYWFDKCKSAIDYSTRYPGQVWFAVSINADGRTHIEQTPDGEDMNVVDEITEVDSVDLVTKPALQTKFIRVLESYRDAVNKKDERRQSMSLREARKQARVQLRELRTSISTATSADIPALQESIRQVCDELADATVISRGSVRILESARELAERATSEKDLTPLFVAWNNLIEAVKTDEDEEEGKKRADEAEGRKRAGEHGDGGDDDDDDNAKFGKKVARAAEDPDDSEEEAEDEEEAEAKLTKALRHVSAVKSKLHMALSKHSSEGEGSGDGGGGEYKKNVADAHKALKMAEKVMCSIMGKKAAEADSDDEEESEKKTEGRKRAEEAAKRRLGNLRENFKDIPANVLTDVYKETAQRIREAKQKPTYEVDEAARVVSSKLEMINALLESESIPMKARFSLQPKLLKLETEDEMRAEILGQKALVEAFSAGGFAGKDWKPADIIGAPARSGSVRESSTSGKSGWANGLTD